MNNMGVMMSSVKMDWGTPQDFFDKLNNEFNFTLDPFASDKTAKCKKYFTELDNGLTKNWVGERVFCNPPYGKEIKLWVEKCFNEKNNAELIVMLIPARTDTLYFHKFLYGKAELRFIKGRLKFVGDQKVSGSAPFPSMLAIFKNGVCEKNG